MRLLAALALVGCTSAQAQRETCYAEAKRSANERADQLCPGDAKALKACPHWERLKNDLAVELEGCP